MFKCIETYSEFSFFQIFGKSFWNICKTISGKEQKLNKHIAEFGIFIFFKYFLYILTKFKYFFKVLKIDFTIPNFSIFSIPSGNPISSEKFKNRHD